MAWIERVWNGRDWGHLIDFVATIMVIVMAVSSIFISAAVVTAWGDDEGLRPKVYDCPKYTLLSECGEKVPDMSVSGDFVVGAVVVLTIVGIVAIGFMSAAAIRAFIRWIWPRKI